MWDSLGSTSFVSRLEKSSQTAPFLSFASGALTFYLSSLGVSHQLLRVRDSLLEWQSRSRLPVEVFCFFFPFWFYKISFVRRRSTNMIYQAKWDVYRRWCRSRDHSVSCPSLPKVADFLLYLHVEKYLSVFCIEAIAQCFLRFSVGTYQTFALLL